MYNNNQAYLPEGMHTKKSLALDFDEKFQELTHQMHNKEIAFGKVVFCHANADYIIVDLGFGITGIVWRNKISTERIFSVAHSLVGQEINFIIEEYNDEKKSFSLSRVAVQNEARKWQEENFRKGKIISAKVTNIIDKGIIADIGSGVEAFLPPKNLTKSFIKDFNNEFFIGQEINLLVEGYDKERNCWALNYINCPQFGLTINSTYAVTVYKQKTSNCWFCCLSPSTLKGLLISKDPLKVGDTEKATIIGFRRGKLLLKPI